MANNDGGFRRRENDISIRVLQAIDVCYARIFHQLIVQRPSQLPSSGPAILVCNHTSSLDPVLIQAVCPRLIRWMMAKEYFDVKPLRFFFNAVGVILVDRGRRDMAATRTAMRALDDGYVLGIFPEGRIETTTDLLPFQSGIGLLALRTAAPVYPAFLNGTQRGRDMVEAFIRPCKATIAFAPRLDLTAIDANRQGVQLATDRIRSAVESLKGLNTRRFNNFAPK